MIQTLVPVNYEESASLFGEKDYGASLSIPLGLPCCCPGGTRSPVAL